MAFCTPYMSSISPARKLSLGIDYGTSGVRAAVVDLESRRVHQVVSSAQSGKNESLEAWDAQLEAVVSKLPAEVRSDVQRVAVNGTSATVVLNGEIKMYNYAETKDVTQRIRDIAPSGHTAAAATSSLAKYVAWGGRGPVEHQADYVARSLTGGSSRISDWHNALKMGYDPGSERWPQWLSKVIDVGSLMAVVPPGTVIGEALAKWGFSPGCEVVAGTTDSIAAFIASGANELGEACTSLGSSLALKVLSSARVDDAQFGLYSHRHFVNGSDRNPLWLVGGASNVGGRTLLELGFTTEQISSLSEQIDLQVPPETALDLYPLPPSVVGERFPVNDPERRPKLDRLDASDVDYLRGLLESIAHVELEGYNLLHRLGAPYPTKVFSAGGGAYNPTYTAIREAKLNAPVLKGHSTEACVGTAFLAAHSLKNTAVVGNP